MEALHFLMKPVDRGTRFAVLGRAAERLGYSERAVTLELQA